MSIFHTVHVSLLVASHISMDHISMTDGEMCTVGQNFSAIHYFHIMAAPGSRAWEFYLEWKGSPPLHSSSEAAANSEPVNYMTSKKKKKNPPSKGGINYIPQKIVTITTVLTNSALKDRGRSKSIHSL